MMPTGENSMHLTEKRELRRFGWVFAGALLLFNIIYWYKNGQFNLILTGLSIAFVLVASIIPMILKPIYILWMKIGHLLGRINSVILLTLLYFLIIVPTGVFMRVFRLSSASFEFRKNVESYWISREHHSFSKENMNRLF